MRGGETTSLGSNVRPGLRSWSVLSLLCPLLSPALGCSKHSEFHFTIDRSAWLADTGVAPGTEMEVSLMINEKETSFWWPDESVRTTYRIIGRASASIKATVKEENSGGSIERTVSAGDTLCLVGQSRLTRCTTSNLSDCNCEWLGVVDPDGGLPDASDRDGGFTPLDPCRGADSETLALYAFESASRFGEDETGRHHATYKEETGPQLDFSDEAEEARCGDTSLTRNETPTSESTADYLDLLPTDTRQIEEPLLDNFYSLEVSVRRVAASGGRQTIIAAEKDGATPAQFDVSSLEDGHLLVRVAQRDIDDLDSNGNREEFKSYYYCYADVIPTDGNWNDLAINLRNGSLEVYRGPDRVAPARGRDVNEQVTCHERVDAPRLGDAGILDEAFFTVGISHRPGPGSPPKDPIGPELFIDQLRLRRSRYP